MLEQLPQFHVLLIIFRTEIIVVVRHQQDKTRDTCQRVQAFARRHRIIPRTQGKPADIGKRVPVHLCGRLQQCAVFHNAQIYAVNPPVFRDMEAEYQPGQREIRVFRLVIADIRLFPLVQHGYIFPPGCVFTV